MLDVREATAADLESIAAIHVAGWRTSYRGILPASLLQGLKVEDRVDLWAEWISGPGVHTFVASRGGKVIGFARLCPARPIASPPELSAEVSHLYVDPAEQGRGAGRLLLEHALQIAQSSGYRATVLWVLEENHRARAFYETLGFSPDGARRTDPELLGNDAVEVRYWLPLNPAAA